METVTVHEYYLHLFRNVDTLTSTMMYDFQSDECKFCPVSKGCSEYHKAAWEFNNDLCFQRIRSYLQEPCSLAQMADMQFSDKRCEDEV